jgi:transcriptional regulator with XRE-family HTH domain
MLHARAIMRDEEIGRSVRTLRHRRGWRQTDLSERANRPRSALVDLEAGRLGALKLDTIRAFADALGARFTLTLASGAGDPRLLIDAGHAFLQDHWKSTLQRWGWLVRAEVSFNHYGERGRIDLLAYHPTLRILLVIEIKTVLWDIQALLGGLDVKVRVAPFTARELGWQPRITLPGILLAAGTTVRRRIDEHTSLFAPFDLRGRAAISWLRRPEDGPHGLLILTELPDVAPGDRRRAGRRRVRLSSSSPRSRPPSADGTSGSKGA